MWNKVLIKPCPKPVRGGKELQGLFISSLFNKEMEMMSSSDKTALTAADPAGASCSCPG